MTALGVGSAFYFHSLRYIFSRIGWKGKHSGGSRANASHFCVCGRKKTFLFSIKSRVIFNEVDKDPEKATSEIFIFVVVSGDNIISMVPSRVRFSTCAL